MALKSVLESIDDLSDDVKKEYVQRGDVFVLDIEDFGKHPGAVKLKNTLDNLDKDKRTLATELTTVKERFSFVPEDFDADKFADLLKGKTPNADIEAEKQRHTNAVQALQDKHKLELAAAQGTINQLSSNIENGAIASTLKTSLLDVGVDPDLLEGALLTVRPLAKAVKDDTGNVTSVVIDTDLGEVAVADFAKEWAGTKGKAYLGKAGGPGGDGNRQHTRNAPPGDFGGDKAARTNAIAQKFPGLPAR